MGQVTTLDMRGQLALSIDGVRSNNPLNVSIENIQLDLEELMAQGGFTINGVGKAQLVLDGVRLELTVDAAELLARSGVRMIDEIEKELLSE